MLAHQQSYPDDEDDDSSFLSERQVSPAIRGSIVIPLSQILVLCLVTMAIGATIPIMFAWNKSSGNTRVGPTFNVDIGPTVFEEIAPISDDVKNANLRQHSVEMNSNNMNITTIPKIAWLMSFPNSGTSFTIGLVETASNMSMASNYAWEHSGQPDAPIQPLQKGGPYWLDSDLAKPQNLVLTKTHCGGFCHNCGPHKSIETPHSFLLHCSRAEENVIVNGEETNKFRKHVYDYEHDVDRAVHLIRDPLDNMVSRYHLGLHKVEHKGDMEKLQRYTYDAQGFRNFCDDHLYDGEEHTDSHMDQDVLTMIKDVPCHLDLFRYVQWHNLAFITTQDLLQIPTHMLHYHDYSDDFPSTLTSLLDFLDLPNTGAVTEFETGKSYRDYFSTDQIAAMRNATRRLASRETWEHLERYF